jgi:hypothetical protein
VKHALYLFRLHDQELPLRPPLFIVVRFWWRPADLLLRLKPQLVDGLRSPACAEEGAELFRDGAAS